MRLLFLSLTCIMSMAIFAQDISSHYKIYDSKTKSVTTIEKIVADMAFADVLFFGEEHNDSAAHYLEHAFFTALYNQYPGKVALSLEMFEADNQLVLNEYLKGFIDETRLSRDARLWNNYRDYRPMIEFAKQNKIPVVAANPPRRYVNLVSRRGRRSLDSLDKESKKFLPPLPYDTLGGRYREKFMDIMKGSPGSGSANIYYSQSLWDAGMAYNIYKFIKENKRTKIFHCAGKFHVEEKLGTVAQLQLLNKKLRVINIIALSDKAFKQQVLTDQDWQKLAILGDYIILTNPDLKKTY